MESIGLDIPHFDEPMFGFSPPTDSLGTASGLSSPLHMPQRTSGNGLDADTEFTKMQLDFLDSQTQLSLQEYQKQWDVARYGPAPGQEEEAANLENAKPGNVGEAHESYVDEAETSPNDGDIMMDEHTPGMSKKKRAKETSPASAAAVAGGKKTRGPTKKRAKKEVKKEKKEKKVSAPPKEHPFGDLNKFAPPPKNPASSFMQFSRKFRAGRERGKAPNAKTVSEAWNVMTEEQRQPFVDLADEDKRRVQKEIDEYIAAYPEYLSTIDDYKLLVSVLREKDKRERDTKGIRRQRDSSTHGSSE